MRATVAQSLSERQGQEQKQTLSLEARQIVKVLTMSMTELADHLVAMLDENPFLCEESTAIDSEEFPLNRFGHVSLSDRVACADIGRNSLSQSNVPFGQPIRSFENYIASDVSLEDHYACQLRIELEDELDVSIGEALVGSTDASGYLNMELNWFADDFNVSLARVERVHHVLTHCFPAGIASRSVRECLLSQVEAQEIDSAVVCSVVDTMLDLLAVGKYQEIANQLCVDIEEVYRACDQIRQLEPRPARFFAKAATTIWPEVLVSEKEGGGYDIALEEFYLPRVVIDSSYFDLMRGNDANAQSEEYFSHKMKEARGVIAGIGQRKKMILSTSTFIVTQEKEYFSKGMEYMKPLTMAEAACALGVSESTISRIAKNTYMATPQGVVGMRMFFHSTAAKDGEKNDSSLRVKHAICRIVGEEDKAKPLSDEQIKDKLEQAGMVVSRRVVNKYRNSLGIRGASQRKRNA